MNNTTDLTVQLMFTNFVASSHLHEVNTDDLKKYSNDLRNFDSVGRQLSNRLGWQSANLNLRNPDPALIPLMTAIIHRVKSLYEQLEFTEEYEPYIDLMWININGKYNYNKEHEHPCALFSGCFYVNCPGPNSCGNIVFQNPNQLLKYYLNADAPRGELMKRMNHLTSAEWFVEPSEGKLLLFPGWLSHYVAPNLNDEERISIAFNILTRKIK